jgi:NAD(P) transhydrogenase subunit alpha
LQAIATARRLGAVVDAYDVRPAVREEIQSLGANFVDLSLETADAEGQGGYARDLGAAFYRRQQEALADWAARATVVISTASVPGRPAPVLVTADAVARMKPGSVIVDLAAEQGGNCELTQPDETIVAHGVTILGPTNLPATVPFHASEMLARNLSAFLLHLAADGQLELDGDDEVLRETLVVRGGEIVHPRVLECLHASCQTIRDEGGR